MKDILLASYCTERGRRRSRNGVFDEVLRRILVLSEIATAFCGGLLAEVEEVSGSARGSGAMASFRCRSSRAGKRHKVFGGVEGSGDGDGDG